MKIALLGIATLFIMLVGQSVMAQDQADALDVIEFDTVDVERVLLDQTGLKPNRSNLYRCRCRRPCVYRDLITSTCVIRGNTRCKATCISELRIENMRITKAKNLEYISSIDEPLPFHRTSYRKEFINCSENEDIQSYKITSEKTLAIETTSTTSFSQVRSWSVDFQISRIVKEGIGWSGGFGTSESITIGSQGEEKNFDRQALKEEREEKDTIRPFTKKTITYTESLTEAYVDVQAHLVIDGDVSEYSVIYDTQRAVPTGIAEGKGHPIGRLSSLVNGEELRSVDLNARVRVSGRNTFSKKEIHEKELTKDSEECKASGN